MARSNSAIQNAASFVVTALGLRGTRNLASWAVAGTLAYFLWIKPEQEKQKELEARAAYLRENDPFREVNKVKPIPDPQSRNKVCNMTRSFKECRLQLQNLPFNPSFSPEYSSESDHSTKQQLAFRQSGHSNSSSSTETITL